MKIINQIHNKEWFEHNPNFKEEEKEFTEYTIDGSKEKWKVDGFRREDGRLILRLTHNELNYTTGQSKKGIKPPIEYKVSEYDYRKDHYHYYLAESTKLRTYTCSSCQGNKPKLKCCKEAADDFFEDGYDGGDCHACYDWKIELKCVKCYIKKNRFSMDCRLEDNGDYIVRSQNYLIGNKSNE